MTEENKKIDLRNLTVNVEYNAVNPYIDKASGEFKLKRKEALQKIMEDVNTLKINIGDEIEVVTIPYRTSFTAPKTSLWRQGEIVEITNCTLENYIENLKRFRQLPISFNSLPKQKGLVYNVKFEEPINEDGVPAFGLLHLRKNLNDCDYYSQIEIGFPSIIDYKRIN